MAFQAPKRFRGFRETGPTSLLSIDLNTSTHNSTHKHTCNQKLNICFWNKTVLESNILTTAIARKIHVQVSLAIWQLLSAILWDKQDPPKEVQVHVHPHDALINKK